MRIAIRHRAKEDRYFLASLIIYVSLTFIPYMKSLPVVLVNMPIMVLSYALLLISIANHKGRKFAGTVVFYSIIIILINFLFIYLQSNWSGASFVNKIGANYALFVTSYPVLILISGGLERVDKKRLSNIFLILITIICITTIVGTYKYWAPCRQLATPYNPELNAKYEREGIASYGFIYFLVIICPILLRELIKKVSIIHLTSFIASIFCVIRSEYTTAIIVMTIAIILSVFMYKKSLIGIVATAIIGITVLINSDSILRWAISFFEGKSLTIMMRLQQMLQFSQYNSMSGDMLIRQDRYLISISSFLGNPLFGGFLHSGSAVGGHSEILDLLGHSGIIGVFLLIMIIIWIRKHTAIGEIKDSYVRSLFFIALIIAIVNTFSAPELFFAILVVPVLFEEQDKDKILEPV